MLLENFDIALGFIKKKEGVVGGRKGLAEQAPLRREAPTVGLPSGRP
jgi:hypothetical protein